MTRRRLSPAATTVLARTSTARLVETLSLALAGAVLGGVTGRTVAAVFGVDGAVSNVIVAVGAAIAAFNGGLGGWRGTYEAAGRGVVAFLLDSTWSLLMTIAGVFATAVAATQKSAGYIHELSLRQNRHVYARGFTPRSGYLITLGNTINGAGDTSNARKQRLITDHEDVHIWQSRWFGPLYPALYLTWMLGFGAAGAVVWALKRPKGGIGKTMETLGYHVNPFEWWAYSRDDNWPPRGKLPGLGWRKPVVRPLAESRAARAARRAGRSAGRSASQR